MSFKIKIYYLSIPRIYVEWTGAHQFTRDLGQGRNIFDRLLDPPRLVILRILCQEKLTLSILKPLDNLTPK